MLERLRFFYNRIRERLWVRPLAMVIFSIGLVFLANLADHSGIKEFVPDISVETIDSLLTIIASSMLVFATFSVSSMVSAYASASNTATPRSFALVIADDVSQNAPSTFIGAFIFSIVALALKNYVYDTGGRFALFIITLLFFFIVILTFVRWVDRIARLGRLGTTIDNVEKTAAKAFNRIISNPHQCAMPLTSKPEGGEILYAEKVGYLQRVDIAALQEYAEEAHFRIAVATLPGSFATPDRILAHLYVEESDGFDIDKDRLLKAFVIGDCRTFDEDPRFGLIVLSEIASRALSPAVNDPGTAIDVLGRMVRIFLGRRAQDTEEPQTPKYDRVMVPTLDIQDVFDDAFSSIARDGAGTVDVAIRLQKALQAIAQAGDPATRNIAKSHARLALERSEKSMDLPDDFERVKKEAAFAFTS